MAKPISLFTAAFIIALFGPTVDAQSRASDQTARGASSALDRTLTFADMDWGTPRDTVRKILPTKGYEYVKANEYGDDVYLGVAGSTVVEVWTFFASGRLAKVLLELKTSDEDARSTYDILVRAAKEEHGEPSGSMERYDPPYRKGDGFESDAVKVGKAMIATLWKTPGAPSGAAGMAVQITKDMTVTVTYESTRWADEVRRRQRKTGKNF